MNRQRAETVKNVATGVFAVGALTATGVLLKSALDPPNDPAVEYSNETTALIGQAQDAGATTWPREVADALLEAELAQRSGSVPVGITEGDLDARINGLTAELEAHVMTNERVRAALAGRDGAVAEQTRLGVVQAAVAAGVDPTTLLFKGVVQNPRLTDGPQAELFADGVGNIAVGTQRAMPSWPDLVRGFANSTERSANRGLGG